MAALGIDMTDTEPVTDWTGLTSGHKRPPMVERLFEAKIDAWAAYIEASDDEPLDHERLAALRRAAFRADHEYNDAYDLWQLSHGECTCTPRHMCRACVARARLADDGEMPF